LSLTGFQNFPELVAFFPDFPDLENAKNKILGLSRFSRTHTNPELKYVTKDDQQKS